MDDIERAQEREQLDRELAIAAVRRRYPQAPAVAARDCRACGEPIQPQRLRAWPAAVRCTWCQVLAERLERGR